MSKKYVVKRTSPQARTVRFRGDGRKLVLPHNGCCVWSLSDDEARRLAEVPHTEVTPLAAPAAPSEPAPAAKPSRRAPAPPAASAAKDKAPAAPAPAGKKKGKKKA